MSSDPTIFGFPDFQPKVREQYRHELDAIVSLTQLAVEMLSAAEKKGTEPVEQVVSALTRFTLTGMVEVMMLCGNGCGNGAMKIVRGMYESRWMAEYLLRHPEEVQDYFDFSKVLKWRRFQWLLEKKSSHQLDQLTPEVLKTAGAKYEAVKERFTSKKGRVRDQWSKKTIKEMAAEIGCREEYVAPYSIACSIHHANPEGLLIGVETTPEGEVAFSWPPSMEWVELALLCSHANLLRALHTLCEACQLQFMDRLSTAVNSYARLYRDKSAGPGHPVL